MDVWRYDNMPGNRQAYRIENGSNPGNLWPEFTTWLQSHGIQPYISVNGDLILAELPDKEKEERARRYNEELDERNRIAAENREKPWLPGEEQYSQLFPERTVHRANPRENVEDVLKTIEESTQPDWRAIEEQAKRDLEAIQTDEDAIRFINTYFAQDLRHDYLKIYRSDRHEMLRSPRQAIDDILSLPPIQ